MKSLIKRQKGFTLAEVLVTIAIIAILAAVLLPVLSSQLRKGDITRVASDLNSVRTGVEAFLADIRRAPSEVDHLIEGIAITDDDINEDLYPAGLVARWQGPYIDKIQDPSTFNIATGFGGVIRNTLSTESLNSVTWVVVEVDSLTDEEFTDIDMVVDGSASSTTGRLRFNASSTMRYLMMPIN